MRLDFDDFNFQQNESRTISRSDSPNYKCWTLWKFSIHILSLNSIDFHCEASIQILIRVVDENNKIKTLEFKGLDCSAVFNRISDNEKSILPTPTSTRSIARPSRSKLRRLFALVSCHKGEPFHETILPTQNSKRKRISPEPCVIIQPSIRK